MIQTADGEFYSDHAQEEIDLPPSFEYLDMVDNSYVYGQKGGQWGRLLTWYPNYNNLGAGWLVEKIDIKRCCKGQV